MRSTIVAVAIFTFCGGLFLGAQNPTPEGVAAAERTEAELHTVFLTAPWGRVVRAPDGATTQTQASSLPSGVEHSELSAQVSGVYMSRSFSNPVKHFDTNSAGLLIAYRYRFNGWEAIEGEYGYTRNGQRYVTPPTTPGLPGALVGVAATMQEAVANEVLMLPLDVIQPFFLAGGGAVFFNPRAPSDIAPVSSQTRAAGNVGVGIDVHLGHVGARVEYQGLFFKVPDFNNPALTTNRYSFVSQPSAGLILTF